MEATGAATTLLERADELQTLADALTEARAGRGRLLLVEAPAGLGKTRLLGALRAELDDVALLHARGGELERDFAFGVVRQLLGPALAAVSDDERARLLSGPAARAAEPAGVVLADSPPPTADADASFAVLHGLHWLVTNLTAAGPLAIVVDDAHWADTPSLRFLAYLARRLDDLPVFVGVAARPAEPGAPAELVDALAAEAAAVLRPAPLSAPATAALVAARLGADPDPVFTQACHTATAGNPFLLGELLAALAADGATPGAAGADRVRELGPASISRAALARLARLGPDAADLARAVAILGTQADLRQAADLAGLDGARAAELADALAAADLFAHARPLDFAHPIVRRAIYDDLPLARRAALHAAAARALHADGGPAEAIAAHLLATEPAADPWVVEQLRAAATRASADGAPDVAATLLERARREPPPEPQRAAVATALGAALARSSDRPGAIARLREAVDLAANPFERLLAAVELGQVLLLDGRADEAAVVLERELDELPPAMVDLGLTIQGALLVAAFAHPEAHRRVVGRPWRFDASAATPGTPSERLWLAIQAFSAGLGHGRADEATAIALRSLDGGRLLSELGPDVPAFYLAANTLVYAEALDAAHETLTQAAAEARRRGSLRGTAMAHCWRSLVALWCGDLGEAAGDAQLTLDAIAHAELGIGRPLAAAFLAQALLESGDLEGADAAVALGRDSGPARAGMPYDFLLLAAGRVRAAQGRHAEALEDLLACGRRQEEHWRVRPPGAFPWRSEAARVQLVLGRPDAAEALVTEELRRARAFGAPRPISAALRAQAAVRGGDEAIGLLREAAALLGDGHPAQLEHAYALVDLGAALRRAGHRADARDPLRQGLDLARRCGAEPLAARAHDELTAAGVRQRKILRSGVSALTPSEQRIARLAAAGRSNREIAQELFVTVRTVEAHLGHAYRKLGVDGRPGLARALGLTPPPGADATQ